MRRAPRVAVIGHVEWVTHARGEIPGHGEIGMLREGFDEAAGGGAVAAAQVAKLGADCSFYTALGSDEAGRRAAPDLEADGVRVLAARRDGPQRRALSIVGDADADRTILVIGEPEWPRISDPLPWGALADADGAYFTGDDPETLRAARAAPVLVVTARRLAALVASGVRADVLVASAADPGEAVDPSALPVAPDLLVITEGARGGAFHASDGRSGRYPAVDPPGPVVDAYGAGDSFAAGLTTGLARGLPLASALALGALCGAICATGRGGRAPQHRAS